MNPEDNHYEDNSPDYNSKFKALSSKISNIALQSKTLTSTYNRLDNKINIIESKSFSRFQSIDHKFTALKEQYTKLTKQYEDNAQFYKQIKKVIQSKQVEQKVNNQLLEQRENITSYIDTIFTSIESNLGKMLTINEEDISYLKSDAKNFQQEATNSISEIIEQISKENEEQLQTIDNIANESNNEFRIIYGQLQTELDKNKEIRTEFLKNCQEVKEKMNEEFNKSKISREEFEENIFGLIEDTCIKLTESSPQ